MGSQISIRFSHLNHWMTECDDEGVSLDDCGQERRSGRSSLYQCQALSYATAIWVPPTKSISIFSWSTGPKSLFSPPHERGRMHAYQSRKTGGRHNENQRIAPPVGEFLTVTSTWNILRIPSRSARKRLGMGGFPERASLCQI